MFFSLMSGNLFPKFLYKCIETHNEVSLVTRNISKIRKCNASKYVENTHRKCKRDWSHKMHRIQTQKCRKYISIGTKVKPII